MLRIPKSDSLSCFFLMSFVDPGGRGLWFIEPPEPPVATPLVLV